jgi:dienelactone hydrolase
MSRRRRLVIALVIGSIAGNVLVALFALAMTARAGPTLVWERFTNPSETFRLYTIGPLEPATLPYPLTPELAFDPEEIDTREAFNIWRRRVVKEYEVMLRGDWTDWDKPYQGVLTRKIIARPSSRNPLQITRMEISSPLVDDNIIVYKIDPLASENRVGGKQSAISAVIAIPGTSDEGVAGLMGWIADYQEGAAITIAQAGYVVYVVQLYGDGERRIHTGSIGRRGFTATQVLERYGQLWDKPLIGLYVKELSLVVDYIVSEDDTPTCLATFGISRGGELAYQLAAFRDEIDAVVADNGLNDLDTVFNPLANLAYAGGMYRLFRHSDIAATVAPRPMLVSWGDRGAKAVGAPMAVNRLEPAYELFDDRESLTFLVHQRGHTWEPDTTLSFLEQHCPQAATVQPQR